MRELPSNQLNPKIKAVWRLNSLVWLSICFLLCFPPFFLAYVSGAGSWSFVVSLTILCLYVLGLILFLLVLPPIRFMRWRYEIFQDYLDIAYGIIWRRRIIIPFIRVQNTDTRQGPILRLLKLASVTVATAAGEHVIPGLDTEAAEELRDRASELARLAQEDV